MSENVAKTVRESLRALGKNQQWLADELEVSVNAVSKWCRTGQISRDKIPKVAALLQRPLSDFFPNAPELRPAPGIDLDEPDTATAGTSEQRALDKDSHLERVNSQECELLRFFREGSDEARAALLNNARLLAKR
jgi:transcriptional regulator with XRE-family HTH domain